jgi:hypothetical protein
MNLLRELAEAKLPCRETDPAKIDRLRVLEAAGHLKVLIPPTHFDCDHRTRQDPATVFEITPHGWKSLQTNAIEEETPFAKHRPTRARSSSAALDLAQLAAWFSSTRRRPGD